jgi:hypothetical protein
MFNSIPVCLYVLALLGISRRTRRGSLRDLWSVAGLVALHFGPLMYLTACANEWWPARALASLVPAAFVAWSVRLLSGRWSRPLVALMLSAAGASSLLVDERLGPTVAWPAWYASLVVLGAIWVWRTPRSVEPAAPVGDTVVTRAPVTLAPTAAAYRDDELKAAVDAAALAAALAARVTALTARARRWRRRGWHVVLALAPYLALVRFVEGRGPSDAPIALAAASAIGFTALVAGVYVAVLAASARVRAARVGGRFTGALPLRPSARVAALTRMLEIATRLEEAYR